MTRVVMTGATSFLGKYLIDELGSRGMEALAIIRPDSRKKDMYRNVSHVQTVLADMDDVERWKKEIRNADYFMHLGWDGVGAAGRADVNIQNKNIKDALNCMRVAEALGCKGFLFAGSQAEYGPQTELISEDTACNPVIEYGKAKLQVCNQAMALAQNSPMRYYHTRIFSVYGEGDHPWALVSSCIRTLCDGAEMKLSSCMQYWNYMYVTDAAYALCGLLVSDAETGIYNIASKDTRRLKRFVEEIYDACGRTGSLSYGAYDYTEKPVSLQPDITRLTKAVGDIPMTAFADAVARMVRKYRMFGEQ